MKGESLAESLLHEIWKDHSRFLLAQPLLADGTPVTIVFAGDFNDHRGGPDFMNAEISIDGLRIKGDIELHRTIDDWDEHGHSEDRRYSQVVLHVVLDADHDDVQHALPRVPLLVLRDNLAFDQRTFWQELFEKKFARVPELPCFPHNLSISMKFKRKVIRQMGEARLDERIARILPTTESPITDEAIIDRVYELVFDALGYSENRTPFLELARLVPRSILQQIRARENSGDLQALFEALYFGTSGLLAKPSADLDAASNEYALDLAAKWEALKVDYEMPESLAENDWAFFRIRPLNSPHRRIALAAVLARKYFSRSNYSIQEEIEYELGDSPFWEIHTSIKQTLGQPHALLGDERSRAIKLNVLLPARIAMERERAQRKAWPEEKIQGVIKPLRKEWSEFPSRSTANYLHIIEQELLESEHLRSTLGEQGALYLFNNYCSKLRCSECPVGQRLAEKGWKPLR
ncbi:MAG: DUF2851 family protein [Bacteroidota bacterium]|nr:DUF2851 family protein [Bacteroidota bacterium]MDP4230672.1 DUF2851 family protein [Bacteroidota bacterium]MDP4235362.1 DUF2851 family protein [Bacteroidota bacterium]